MTSRAAADTPLPAPLPATAAANLLVRRRVPRASARGCSQAASDAATAKTLMERKQNCNKLESGGTGGGEQNEAERLAAEERGRALAEQIQEAPRSRRRESSAACDALSRRHGMGHSPQGSVPFFSMHGKA